MTREPVVGQRLPGERGLDELVPLRRDARVAQQRPEADHHLAVALELAGEHVTAALRAEVLGGARGGLPAAHALTALGDREAVGGHEPVQRPRGARPALAPRAVAVAGGGERLGDLERHGAAGAGSLQDGHAGRLPASGFESVGAVALLYAPPVTALVLQHGDWGPPGLLADWLRARGIPFDLHRTYVGEPMPSPDGYAFVVSLGSDRNPRDVDDPAVAAELELLARAVELDTPVLGLCFGGQALAAVLGAPVTPAPVPELGWCAIETDDPALLPPGPWLEWHFERFGVPPGAVEIARSPSGPQA